MDAQPIAEAYAAGATTAELAERFNVHRRTIYRRLRAAGVEIRLGRPRSSEPRTCDVCGKPVRDPRTRAHHACSRVHPLVSPRPCEHCGAPFTPPALKVAHGRGGRFCRYKCWNAWRTGRPQREWRR